MDQAAEQRCHTISLSEIHLTTSTAVAPHYRHRNDCVHKGIGKGQLAGLDVQMISGWCSGDLFGLENHKSNFDLNDVWGQFILKSLKLSEGNYLLVALTERSERLAHRPASYAAIWGFWLRLCVSGGKRALLRCGAVGDATV